MVSRKCVVPAVLAVAFIAYSSSAAQPVADRVYGAPNFSDSQANNPILPYASMLSQPKGVAVTAEGVYIADYNNSRTLFYPAGSTVATRVYGQQDFTTFDLNHGGLNENSQARPWGIAANATGLYVADYRNSRVLFYPPGSTTAALVYGQPNFGSSFPNWNGLTPTSLSYPEDVAVDDEGNVYIADSGNSRVLYYPRGSNVATKVWGAPDMTRYHSDGIYTGPDRFFYTKGVAVNNTGLYVTDHGNNRVLFFPSGSTVASRVYGQPNFTARTPNTNGIGPSTLQQPHGVAVDSSGVYIADYLNGRVLYYEGTSTVASAVYGQPDFTTVGLGWGQTDGTGMYVPWGVSCDDYGVYIADAYNSRILRFPKQGAEVPASIAITTQPGSGVAGQPLTVQPVVTVKLTNGTTATTYSGPVRLALRPVTGAACALASGNLTINAVGGVAQFSNVAIDTPGTYQFRATAATFPLEDSTTISILPPAGTQVLGDINKDGGFNLQDVVKLTRILAGLDTFTQG